MSVGIALTSRTFITVACNMSENDSSTSNAPDRFSSNASWLSFLGALKPLTRGKGAEDLAARLPASVPDKDYLAALFRPEMVEEGEASVAASCFLFRKVLPGKGGPGAARAKYVVKMGVPSKEPDPGFLLKTAVVIGELFGGDKAGVWDAGFAQRLFSLRFNVSSCLEGGDTRSFLASSLGWEDFCRGVMDGDIDEWPLDRRVAVLDEDGKYRIITVASAHAAVLKVLHEMVYDVLSGERWLLRGDASTRAMKERMDRGSEFADGGKAGRAGAFVSGDFEGATDNFNRFVTAAVIDNISSHSRHIPHCLWAVAKRHLVEECRLVDPIGRELGIRRGGQLMGDYLSFPILCLVNYITFVHALGERGERIAREGFLVINGDDIVFWVEEESWAEEWIRGVTAGGLVCSVGKTLVHKRFFSLNSTYFAYSTRQVGGRFAKEARRAGHVRLVPVIRFKTWVKDRAVGLVARLERVWQDLGGLAANCAVKLYVSQRFLGLHWKYRGVFMGRFTNVARGGRQGRSATVGLVRACIPGSWRRDCIAAGALTLPSLGVESVPGITRTPVRLWKSLGRATKGVIRDAVAWVKSEDTWVKAIRVRGPEVEERKEGISGDWLEFQRRVGFNFPGRPTVRFNPLQALFKPVGGVDWSYRDREGFSKWGSVLWVDRARKERMVDVPTSVGAVLARASVGAGVGGVRFAAEGSA